MNELPVAPQEDTVRIDTVDQFAFFLMGWHRNRMAQLQQALTAPDDVDIVVSDEQGNLFSLSAEARKGFRAGLLVAKSLFAELPIGVSEEPAAVEPEAPATEAPSHE